MAMNGGGWAIELERIGKRFGDRTALEGVDFRCAPGEMVAVVGASGAGKSTLLRLINGLLPASEGEARVLGQTLQSGGRLLPGAKRLRAQIGFVFQRFNLVERLTALQNVLAGTLAKAPTLRTAARLFTRAEKLRAMAALDRVGILERAEQRASELSGGEQQRVAIARCLMQEARIVLADEPVASLDIESARKVMELLAELNREDGTTILLSTHQIPTVRRYCPRTLALNGGHVALDGETERLDEAALARIYGTHVDELVLSDPAPHPSVAAGGANGADHGKRG
ncbi:MAG: phosphonate ABC transporter ATP-binding protein [SAR324 cluster bacterium]|nr:phosphonate ABC transporter ATP-binding protein [SAR324 cluster bacterium]